MHTHKHTSTVFDKVVVSSGARGTQILHSSKSSNTSKEKKLYFHKIFALNLCCTTEFQSNSSKKSKVFGSLECQIRFILHLRSHTTFSVIRLLEWPQHLTFYLEIRLKSLWRVDENFLFLKPASS